MWPLYALEITHVLGNPCRTYSKDHFNYQPPQHLILEANSYIVQLRYIGKFEVKRTDKLSLERF